jgi:hypothetical protein
MVSGFSISMSPESKYGILDHIYAIKALCRLVCLAVSSDYFRDRSCETELYSKSSALCEITPCSPLKVKRPFGGTCYADKPKKNPV